MARQTIMQTSFNAGEFSPLLEGYLNLEKRADALSLCQNLIPLKQGPLVRRGGTYFVKEVKTSANRTHLIPFQFSTTQAYQIETGDQYFRFYRDNGVVTAAAQNITGITKANPAVVTYSGSDTYANGDQVYISGVVGMTEVNGKFFTVANVNTGANTFELSGINSTNYTTYTSGGTVAEVYTVSSPYLQADLFDSSNLFQIQYAQSADVLYLIHGGYAPRTLSRTAHNAWTLTTLSFNDGPYLDENTTATTITLSGTSGSVTVTASGVTGINGGAGFASTDVGRLIRFHDGTNWTWLEITAFTDTTHVTATVRGATAGATTATTRWRLGVYSATTGYPRAITFFQNRVVLGGCSSYPDRFDMTKTGGYSQTELLFAPTKADGTVADDYAISGTLQSGRVNAIQWMDQDTRGLVIGTAEQEWVVRASDLGEALTPTNARAEPFSKIGSAYIQAVKASSGLIFTQRARRRVHDVIYSFEQDTLQPRDLTLLGEHITQNQIIGMSYQQEPVNVLWAVRNDGLLIGQTYYPEQQVVGGWHRHVIGGWSNSDQDEAAIVECVSVIPSADGTRDELWLIVKRYIDGATVRYIEYMKPYFDTDAVIEDAFHMDCGLTYSGTATGTVSGLEHLEGQTLKVLADGKSQPAVTVTDGSITLANSRTASKIHLGLANTWAFETLQPEAGSQDGVSQGKTKRVTGVVLRLLNSLGLSYGKRGGNIDEYDFNQGTAYDTATALFTGDTQLLRWPHGYETSGKMYFESNSAFPVAILAVIPDIVTYDRGDAIRSFRA